MPTLPGAPSVLLAHEGVQVVGADPGRQHDRQVDQRPAVPADVQSGVHVLGIGDQRRPAERLERDPPVDGRGADADGGVEAVPGGLNRPVEDFLHGSGRVLDPVLVRTGPEVLRTLDDGDLRVVQIRQQLGQEVTPGCEVSVEDDNQLGIGTGEGIPQVACLLALGQIRPADVFEAELRGHGLRLVGRAVVEHVRLGHALIDRRRGPIPPSRCCAAPRGAHRRRAGRCRAGDNGGAARLRSGPDARPGRSPCPVKFTGRVMAW